MRRDVLLRDDASWSSGQVHASQWFEVSDFRMTMFVLFLHKVSLSLLLPKSPLQGQNFQPALVKLGWLYTGQQQ